MKKLVLTLFLLCLSAGSVRATTINGIFGGTIDVLPGFPPTDYGLGIAAGDHFIGHFSYDLNGFVSNFSVMIQNLSLTATNNVVGAHPYDGFLTYFYILGQLPGNLFMSVALTNGSSVFTTSGLPTSLSDSDWFLACFKIGPRAIPGVESNCIINDITGIVAISGGHNRTADDFFLMTIPEPPSAVLLGMGFLILIVLITCSQHLVGKVSVAEPVGLALGLAAVIIAVTSRCRAISRK